MKTLRFEKFGAVLDVTSTGESGKIKLQFKAKFGEREHQSIRINLSEKESDSIREMLKIDISNRINAEKPMMKKDPSNSNYYTSSPNNPFLRAISDEGIDDSETELNRIREFARNNGRYDLESLSRRHGDDSGPF